MSNLGIEITPSAYPETTQSSGVVFVTEWIDANPAADEAATAAIARDVVAFADEIEDREERIRTLEIAAQLLTYKSPELLEVIEHSYDNQYGFGIPEITPDETGRLLQRLALGKNPAFILRRDSSEAPTNINTLLTEAAGLDPIFSELFPQPGMALTSSTLHLDNFIRSHKNPGFRYSVTAAEVTEGSVLFLAARASRNARKLDRVNYDRYHQKINHHREILRAYDAAHSLSFERMFAQTIEIEEIDTTVHTAPMQAGDIAVWPQGDGAFDVPSWHALREIGNPKHDNFTPRKSVSTYFV